MRFISSVALLTCLATVACGSEEKFSLQPGLVAGDAAAFEVHLEVGGEMLVQSDDGVEKLPMSVVADLAYVEHLIAWSSDAESIARSVRSYDRAEATIKVGEEGVERQLAESARELVAEIRDGAAAINGINTPLARDDFDLVNVVGNTLAIDRLLPPDDLAEGGSWDHAPEVFAALLGMDHVAVCEVTSVVTKSEGSRITIRAGGTVHGTVDGAATEMEIRAAYLFDRNHKRITRFNLAVKEIRQAGEVVPGLDVVAKLRVKIRPNVSGVIDDWQLESASNLDQPVSRQLQYESREQGYRFQHDAAWYVTAESRTAASLRHMAEGELTAHCNITTLPKRGAGRETTLAQFEQDMRSALGNSLGSIVTTNQWETATGHACLGIVARGKVEAVPVEWRYYLIWSPDLPRVSLAFTLEQKRLEEFADADRQIIDSLELVEPVVEKSAVRPQAAASR